MLLQGFVKVLDYPCGVLPAKNGGVVKVKDKGGIIRNGKGRCKGRGLRHGKFVHIVNRQRDYPSGPEGRCIFYGLGHIGAVLTPGGGKAKGNDAAVEHRPVIGAAGFIGIIGNTGIKLLRILFLAYTGKKREQSRQKQYSQPLSHCLDTFNICLRFLIWDTTLSSSRLEGTDSFSVTS